MYMKKRMVYPPFLIEGRLLQAIIYSLLQQALLKYYINIFFIIHENPFQKMTKNLILSKIILFNYNNYN